MKAKREIGFETGENINFLLHVRAGARSREMYARRRANGGRSVEEKKELNADDDTDAKRCILLFLVEPSRSSGIVERGL